MDNTEIETEQDPKENTALLIIATTLAVVGAVVVVNKTILYTRAIVTVAKMKKAEKNLRALETETADPS